MNIRQRPIGTLSLVALSAFAVLLVGGCKNPESQVVGDWKDAGGKVMTFKADKTVSQGSGVQGMTGKWSLANKKVSLTIETIGGKPVDQFIDQMAKMMGGKDPQGAKAKMQAEMKGLALNLSDDGKTMTMAMAGAPSGAAGTLTKVESK